MNTREELYNIFKPYRSYIFSNTIFRSSRAGPPSSSGDGLKELKNVNFFSFAIDFKFKNCENLFMFLGDVLKVKDSIGVLLIEKDSHYNNASHIGIGYSYPAYAYFRVSILIEIGEE